MITATEMCQQITSVNGRFKVGYYSISCTSISIIFIYIFIIILINIMYAILVRYNKYINVCNICIYIYIYYNNNIYLLKSHVYIFNTIQIEDTNEVIEVL